MLKMAKVKSEKEFYKKYPSEEAFMKAHGKAFKKAAMGKSMVNKQLHQLTDFGNPPIAEVGATTPPKFEFTKPESFGAGAETAGMSALQNVDKIIGGIEAIGQQKKAIKKADQSSQLSGLANQAAGTREKVERKYVRPEDALVQPGQLGNPYGTGTNYLAAQNGTMIGGNPTEIQNTYTPGDLYSDLGYEPMEKAYKQYQEGGKLLSRDKINVDSYGNRGTAFRDIYQNPNMTRDTTYAYDSPNAMLRYNTNHGNPNAYVGGRGGFTSAQPDSLAKYKQLLSSPFNNDDSGNMKRLVSGKYEDGGDLPKAEFGEYFQDSGQAQIGSAVGESIGSAFGPAGAMVGKYAGKVIGNLAGGVKDARKLQKYKDETAMNSQQAAWQNQLQSGQFSKSMEHGGYMNPEYNPQVIAKFGDYNVKDLLQPPHDADMLRSGGHLAQVGYTAPSAEAMFTGRPNMPYAEYGTQMAMGGELEVGDGGRLETLSYNPNLPGGEIGMFRGASHDNGGIKTKYGENEVEVEGGEPAVKLQDGGSAENLVVFGNIKINKEIADLMGDPKAKGKKFKTYIADIAKNDAKQLKTIQKGLDLVEEYNGNSSYDKLGMNSGMANLMGAKAQQKINAEKIKEASIVQDAIHQTARQLGAKSDKLAEGKIEKETDPSMVAKFGTNMDIAQRGIKAPLFGRMLGVQDRPAYYNEVLQNQLMNAGMPTKDPEVTPFTKANMLAQGFKDTTDKPVASKSSSAKGKGKGKEKGQDKGQVYVPPTAVNLTDGRQGNYEWTNPQSLPNASTAVAPAYDSFPQSSNITGVDIFGNYTGPQETFADEPGGNSKKRFDWNKAGNIGAALLSNLDSYLRPSNANDDLPPDQLYPEYFALATNQLDPVQAQTYQPMLDTPYDISLNDQINAIDSQARSAIRAGGNNPAAQSMIMAQAIEAKNKVLGEQTRINQTNKMQTYSKNRDLLNDAQLKNLQILDQQYVRQAQAKSNTKQQSLAALSSIAAKTAQQRATNRKLAIMENMYGFRFSPSGRAINMNAPAQFNMSGNPFGGSTGRGLAPNRAFTYDDQQQIVGTMAVPKSKQLSMDDFEGDFKNGGKKSKTKARNSSIVKALKNL